MPLRRAAVALIALAPFVAGCGGGSLDVSTEALAPATTVSAQRYLADAAAAAASARAARVVIGGLPRQVTPAVLRRSADRLGATADRAEAMAQRLAASRLVDRRLEVQRRRIAPLYVALAAALRELADAARAGDPPDAAAASSRLAAAGRALQGASAPSAARTAP